MKNLLFLIFRLFIFSNLGLAVYALPLKVVTTLPDYAVIARMIGGDRVMVSSIVRGDQDAHFIRPKPSFANLVREAEVLIDTGLDLETWLPTVVDTSGNRHVRSGEPGYVSASYGMHFLDKPEKLSRSEGGLHIYGNPHVTCSPVLMRVAAQNIANGLIKNDPAGRKVYTQNLKSFLQEMDSRLFGQKLVDLLGGERLCALAEEGKLIPFLQREQYKNTPLIRYLGGWMGKMHPLYGTSLVTYHKNWIYFFKLFGLYEAGTIEPKPGIPPSAKHVVDLITLMREKNIRIIFAANYFSKREITDIAEKVGAEPVIIPMYVEGISEATDYFTLVDIWVNRLVEAGKKTGMIS